MTKSFVPVKLAYNEFTPNEGLDASLAPILFLHGLTASKEDWRYIPQILADKTKRKAYAFDARNHGDSEYSDVAELDVSVDDLFHFMGETLKIKKAILVGHSLGGAVCIRAALREPERVEMLFVEEMYTRKCTDELFGKMADFQSLWLEGVKNVPKDHPQTGIVRCIVDYMCSKLPQDDPIHWLRKRTFARTYEKENICKPNLELVKKPDGGYEVKYNKEVVLKMLRNPSTAMSEPSGQYDGPAYFVYGEKSPFLVGKEEEDIKKHFPAVMLIEVKGASHNIHTDLAYEFITIISKHLAKAI